MTKIYLVQYHHLNKAAAMTNLGVSTVHSSYELAESRIRDIMVKHTENTDWYISEVEVDAPYVPHRMTFVASSE